MTVGTTNAISGGGGSGEEYSVIPLTSSNFFEYVISAPVGSIMAVNTITCKQVGESNTSVIKGLMAVKVEYTENEYFGNVWVASGRFLEYDHTGLVNGEVYQIKDMSYVNSHLHFDFDEYFKKQAVYLAEAGTVIDESTITIHTTHGYTGAVLLLRNGGGSN